MQASNCEETYHNNNNNFLVLIIVFDGWIGGSNSISPAQWSGPQLEDIDLSAIYCTPRFIYHVGVLLKQVGKMQ